MRLTTRGRYAVTALLDVTLHAATGPVPLADVAARQQISLAYLEQLFVRLRRAGLVRSARGPGGGYRLAQDAADTSVAAILAAVDESLDATRCGGGADCLGGDRCLTHGLWAELSEHVDHFLAGVDLATLAGRADVAGIARRQQGAEVLARSHTP